MNLHHFKRSEVIEKGKERAKKIKQVWLFIGIGCFVMSATSFIVSIMFVFLLWNDNEFIVPTISTGVMSVMCFVIGLYVINYSKNKKTDLLLEGCIAVGRIVKGELNKKNRWFVNDAKRRAKKTRKAIPYFVCISTFDYRKLYELLKENEEAEYKALPKIVIRIMGIDSNNKYRSTSSNRTFDNNFDDEMFDDLMD